MKIDAEVAHSAGTTSESESEVQRVGRWLASEWTNCPAFAQLRSLVFLNKWCMERPRRIATAQLMYVTLNQRCVFNFTGCGCVTDGFNGSWAGNTLLSTCGRCFDTTLGAAQMRR